MKLPWLLVTAALCAVLLAAHLYALSTFLYWNIPWFDIPMHILGGAALGTFLLALGIRRFSLFVLLMIGVVVGWEIFEYIGGMSTHQAHYWRDTIDDMANGLLGAFLSYVISNYIWHSN